MTGHTSKNGFAVRPSDAERWVRKPDRPSDRTSAEVFTARLTLDVTPALRGRIKMAAFQRGLTMANMLRTLLEREFPAGSGAAHD